jgi:hypothetical protein
MLSTGAVTGASGSQTGDGSMAENKQAPLRRLYR